MDGLFRRFDGPRLVRADREILRTQKGGGLHLIVTGEVAVMQKTKGRTITTTKPQTAGDYPHFLR